MTTNTKKLIEQLRDRAYSFKAPDPLVEAAANEIERFRLTDAEREAIEKAISRELDSDWYGGPEPARVVTLRGLLERMK
jgi:hypothetical protein